MSKAPRDKTTARLRRAARQYGILPEYLDVGGRVQQASRETLLGLLRLLGAPMRDPGDAPEAVRAQREAEWSRILEPVLVAWRGKLDAPLRLPASAVGRFDARLRLEQGEVWEWSNLLEDLPVAHRQRVEGADYVARRLRVAEALPWGYHELLVAIAGREHAARVISAPLTACRPSESGRRWWGVFAPLYAIHSRQSWGAGDFGDLRTMMDWVARCGGNLVATLPILAPVSMADDPSPYSPTSRLFWNELYLDPRQIEDLGSCPAAGRLVQQFEEEPELGRLRRRRLVDYPRLAAIKRRVLERLTAACFAESDRGSAELQRYCRAVPEVESFARFRAAAERHGLDWRDWPARMRSGRLRPGDYDESARRYYLYSQWQTEMQVRAAVDAASEKQLLWYFDFPLGVSRVGFDVWREPDLFVLDASAGAPPDAFFTKGQNWDFPPLQPVRLRETGYKHFIAALRRHLQYAKVLRIDHVMGLHRLYWIPPGMDPAEGTYVRYRVDELMAILVLESHRQGALIVGENLGTVPPEVDRAMDRHGLTGMYVLPFRVHPQRRPPLDAVPADTVASLNTHDLPTFAAYLDGRDLEDRVGLGLIDRAESRRLKKDRQEERRSVVRFLQQKRLLPRGEDSTPQVTAAALAFLARSRAAAVLVNLEDLWGETRQQNMPGTVRERPNWRRRARYGLERIARLPDVAAVLRRVAEERTATP